MAANYAKIRDGGKGTGLHYRTFEGFSKLVALKLRKLRREDFQIATRIREVGLEPRTALRSLAFEASYPESRDLTSLKTRQWRACLCRRWGEQAQQLDLGNSPNYVGAAIPSR